MSDRVLVMGYRTGLGRALTALGVEFVVWADKAVKAPGALRVHVGPMPLTREALAAALVPVESDGPFTHVIAGTEAAVLPAARARRALGTRAAPTTVAIRCHDKLAMKRFLHEREVPMTPFLAEDPELTEDTIIEALGFPVVVKARGRSGGRGISFARDRAALVESRQRGALLERFVDAPEISVESFVTGGEVVFESITDYRVKTSVNVVPAPLPPEVEARVRALNRQALSALKLSWGLTHLEMYLTDDGPLFGEVALRPPGGYIMDAIGEAWGFNAWRAFASVELERDFDFPSSPTHHAAVWILHPGAGRVARIDGVEAVRAHPAVRSLKLKIRAGDEVAARAGVGEDVGRVLLRTKDAASVIAALDDVQRALVIELDPA